MICPATTNRGYVQCILPDGHQTSLHVGQEPSRPDGGLYPRYIAWGTADLLRCPARFGDCLCDLRRGHLGAHQARMNDLEAMYWDNGVYWGNWVEAPEPEPPFRVSGTMPAPREQRAIES